MTKLNDFDLEMFALFEMTPDLVCVVSKEGYFRKINPAVGEKLGYTQTELMTNPVSFFIHPEDKDLTGSERAKLLTGQALLNFQNRYVTKQGSSVWLEWTSIYIPDKEIVFAIAKDITKRKEIERQIEEKYKKFKSLATHFKNSIEKDRKYLAIELHEELAQLASVVKFDLDWIRSNSNLSEISEKRIDHALVASDLLINTIRRISFAISPTMLDEMGLNEVLKWLCREFSMLNGISCNFKTSCNEALLSHEMKLDFFRICQEALSNVMYKASAKKVRVTIKELKKTIELCIADDGKDSEKNKQPVSTFANMKERAASINGELHIVTEPGKGTKVTMSIPKHDQYHSLSA